MSLLRNRSLGILAIVAVFAIVGLALTLGSTQLAAFASVKVVPQSAHSTPPVSDEGGACYAVPEVQQPELAPVVCPDTECNTGCWSDGVHFRAGKKAVHKIPTPLGCDPPNNNGCATVNC